MLIFLFVLSILQILLLLGLGAVFAAHGLNTPTRIMGVIMTLFGALEIFSILHLIS